VIFITGPEEIKSVVDDKPEVPANRSAISRITKERKNESAKKTVVSRFRSFVLL